MCRAISDLNYNYFEFDFKYSIPEFKTRELNLGAVQIY